MFEFRSLIGSQGLAHTRLCPSGFIEIDGRLFDAVIRDSPKIERGSEVEVIDTVCFSLVVRILINRNTN